ncbi:MAG: hypothetical protein AMS22_13735 [Thiotrichales bacterium SG8_50]|nr:MAG: hypothetical protein AMS22_13735 [Thiotrichales bacterium SG8_50]
MLLAFRAAASEFSVVQHNFSAFGSEYGQDTIYVKDERMRIESMRENKLDSVTLVDGELNKVYRLDKRTDTVKSIELREWLAESYKAYRFSTFAAYYYRDKLDHLKTMKQMGEESVAGQATIKYRLPQSPHVKDTGPEDLPILWISQKTGTPVRYQNTVGHGRFTTVKTWDSPVPGPQLASLFEMPRDSMTVPSVPRTVFAFSNEHGSHLLALGDVGDPEGVSTAVCEDGKRYALKHLGKQGADPKKDSGRDVVQNFRFLEGNVYKVRSGFAGGDRNCLIATADFFAGRQVLKVGRSFASSSKAGCSPSYRQRIERLRARKVVRCVLLARVENQSVLALEFERRPKDALATVVLVGPEHQTFWDLPGRDDGQSTWRVDDGGHFKPGDLSVLFAFSHESFTELGIAWVGVEGTSLSYLRPKGGRFFLYRNDYRYHAPR